MSANVPNDGFLLCPCGRKVQTIGPENPVPLPHRPGHTHGQANINNRKSRKAAWCDFTKREDEAFNIVRSGGKRLLDEREAEMIMQNKTAADWIAIDKKLRWARGKKDEKEGN